MSEEPPEIRTRAINWSVVIAVPLAVPLVAITVFLLIALWPHLQLIGEVLLISLIGAVIVGKVYVGFWLYCRIGTMLAEKRRRELHSRVIVAGDVVAFPNADGTFTHLSAIHMGALPMPKDEGIEDETEDATPTDIDLVHMHFKEGLSLRAIASKTGVSYNRIQKLTSDWKDKYK